MAFILLLLIAGQAPADEVKARKPGPDDKCPVCGMRSIKYPDFLSQAVLRNGTVLFFDGPKDLFKFHLQRDRYMPGERSAAVDEYIVTDYYEREPINARKAWYVMGSDVRGPMGRELVPFDHEEKAREFMQDHRGQRILRFFDVNAATLGELE